MKAEDLAALKTHGYVFDSDSTSGGSRSDLDDEYYALKPPPIPVANFQHNIVRIPCSTEEINVNTNRSFNLVNPKTEKLPYVHTSISQNVANTKKDKLPYSQIVSGDNIPPASTSTPQNSRMDSSTKKFDTNMNNSGISIINKNVPFLPEYCKNVTITTNHPSSNKIITNRCEIISEATRVINNPRIPQQHNNYNSQLRKDNVNLSHKRTRNNNNNTPAAPLHRVNAYDLHVRIDNTNTEQNDTTTTQPPETKTNCFNTLLMCFCCCCQ